MGMVGHSLGSYESLLFTDRHRADVVGMVLIDPSFPDQSVRLKRAAPAIYALAPPTDQNPLVALFSRCATALRAGTIVRGGVDPDGCLRPPPPPKSYPVELRNALIRQANEPDLGKVARTMDTLSSSLRSVDQSSRMIVSPGRNYGNMPLIVLTATTFLWPPNTSAEAKAELPARQAMWRQGHDELAALSSQGVNRIVADSGHFIQQDQPQAVIDAIDEVLKHSREHQAAPTRR